MSTHFDEPHVVMESSLPKAKEVEALDVLGQDARQLAEASSEGMAGGERNKLNECSLPRTSSACRRRPDD